jgi:hypothetical protein
MRHWTQLPPATLHTGSVALQLLFWLHCEHCEVTVEQMGLAGGQEVLVTHSTQVLLVGSQAGALGWVHWASLVHAVSQVLVAGEQPWPVAQSVAVRQATQPPSTQKGALGLQSLALPHWAQPTPATHPFGHAWPSVEQPPPGSALDEWHEAARSASAPAVTAARRR